MMKDCTGDNRLGPDTIVWVHHTIVRPQLFGVQRHYRLGSHRSVPIVWAHPTPLSGAIRHHRLGKSIRSYGPSDTIVYPTIVWGPWLSTSTGIATADTIVWGPQFVLGRAALESALVLRNVMRTLSFGKLGILRS
jgi:hypothetical protein